MAHSLIPALRSLAAYFERRAWSRTGLSLGEIEGVVERYPVPGIVENSHADSRWDAPDAMKHDHVLRSFQPSDTWLSGARAISASVSSNPAIAPNRLRRSERARRACSAAHHC